ncbi:hypothetical protein IAR55_000071 [Kwoniella newhampshirensis]|uniref:Uncharacterized protein n=1 Tax=Kwoniella newhampshirensis TaxID=1651941 RepID=A0AAW0Z610_9TREE
MSVNPLRFLALPRTLSAARPTHPLPRSFHSTILRNRPTSGTTGTGTPHHIPHTVHAHPRPSPPPPPKRPSPHAVWYREIVPAMLPIFLISTTLFLSLSLLRTYLSHSRSLTEAESRISELEDKLAKYRVERRRARLREKRERERILPLVVEKVLQKVGVVGGEEDEGVVEERERAEERKKAMARLL